VSRLFRALSSRVILEKLWGNYCNGVESWGDYSRLWGDLFGSSTTI